MTMIKKDLRILLNFFINKLQNLMKTNMRKINNKMIQLTLMKKKKDIIFKEKRHISQIYKEK